MNNSPIVGLLGLCRRADYLIIGGDTLKDYKKKLYLIVTNKQPSKNITKIALHCSEKYNILAIELLDEDLGEIIGIKGCQIVGIKNLGMVNQILNKCSISYKIIKRY